MVLSHPLNQLYNTQIVKYTEVFLGTGANGKDEMNRSDI
jgi:hypothetical protein